MDPETGRFVSPDRLLEKFPSVSPYGYCANNPVRLTDPSGMQAGDAARKIAPVMIPGECELGGGGPDYPVKGLDIAGAGKVLGEGSNTGTSVPMPESGSPAGESAEAVSKAVAEPMEVASEAVGSGIVIDARVAGALNEFAHDISEEYPQEPPGASLLAGSESMENAENEQPGWGLGGNKSLEKWTRQMERRGWTPEQIEDAILYGEQYEAPNNINPENGATRYVHRESGRSVVIDNKTGEVLHVGGDGFKY